MAGWFDTIAKRLRAVLPGRWFPDETPVLGAVLAGLGAGTAAVQAQIAYAGTQTRLATVNGPWLDLASLDYKGARVPRRFLELDATYRARLLPILPDKATRPDLEARLLAFTGQAPDVFEAMRPTDTGGYGIARGYNVAGRNGSLSLPFQAFVHTGRPADTGLRDSDLLGVIRDVLPVAVTAWVRLDGTPRPDADRANTAPLDIFLPDQHALA